MTRGLPMFLLLFPGLASAATYTVAVDGSGDYTTIGAELSAAGDGDRVEVAAGTWTEALYFAGKDVELVGMGSDSTILDAGGSSSYALTFASGESSFALVEGFTIHNVEGQGAWISGSNPTFRDVVFEGLGGTGVYGGAVQISSGSPSFSGCVFQDNTAAYGGHVYIARGTPEISDSTLSDGSSVGTGGAIYLASDAGLTLVDTELSANRAAGNGAGIYGVGYNTISVSGGTFYNNYPDEYADYTYGGGAVYLNAGSVLDLSGVTFDANAAYYGGALMLYGTDVVLDGVTFSTNYAYYGGAIYLSDYSTLTDEGGVYDTNTSYYYGAGIYSYYGNEVSVSGATFNENAAYYGYGAAVFHQYYGSMSLTDTTLYKNISYYSGGAVYAYYLPGSTVSLTRVTATDNKATYGYGGAVYAYYYADLNVADSELSNNYAYYSGGGLYSAYYSSLTLTDSALAWNTGKTISGGGVYFDPGNSGNSLTVQGVSIDHNSARYEGGGLYAHYGNQVIEESGFEGNTLEDDSFGGGVFAKDFTVLLARNNVYAANTAVIGGGLYLDQGTNTAASAAVGNSVFAENTASRYGGGFMAVNTTNLWAVNNTFVGNTTTDEDAGGGAAYFYEANVTFRNNLVAWTQGGSAVAATMAEDTTSPALTYNSFFENAPHDLDGDLAGSPLDASNLTDDPELPGYSRDGDASNDSYVLARTSPCVDAGDPMISDVDGSRSDIGAYGGLDLVTQDEDGDGYDSSTDCDDGDATVHPGADETWYDGVNSDCDMSDDDDQDGDGVAVGLDCDDTDASVTDCPEVDSADTGGDTAAQTDDTAAPAGDSGAGETGQPTKEEPGRCGCATQGAGGAGLGLLLIAGALGRRRITGR